MESEVTRPLHVISSVVYAATVMVKQVMACSLAMSRKPGTAPTCAEIHTAQGFLFTHISYLLSTPGTHTNNCTYIFAEIE